MHYINSLAYSVLQLL